MKQSEKPIIEKKKIDQVLIYSESESTSKDFHNLNLNLQHNYNEVFMSNDLVRASQNLTINEKRLISLCISQINMEDRSKRSMFTLEDFLKKRKFVINANVFQDLYEYKNNKAVYRDLKHAALSLYDRSWHIKFNNTNEHIRFVDRVSYNKTKGEVELYFSADVYHYLFEFNGNFTQYNLKIGTNFKSMYAHRIFELLQSRKDTNMIYITLEELRFVLNIPDSYKNYSKIKEKVFIPTAKEFKELGMSFEVSVKKNKLDRTKDIIILSTNKNVNDIAREIGLTEENRLLYVKNKHKAKFNDNDNSDKDSQFIKLKNQSQVNLNGVSNPFSCHDYEDEESLVNHDTMIDNNDYDYIDLEEQEIASQREIKPELLAKLLERYPYLSENELKIIDNEKFTELLLGLDF